MPPYDNKARNFGKSMNAKAEKITQSTQQLKLMVKKIYQLSKEIDSSSDKKLVAKLKRERSLLRFQAQQQANAIEFDKKKVELMSKDFKTKTRSSFAPPLYGGRGDNKALRARGAANWRVAEPLEEPQDEEERQYYKRQAFRTAYAAIIKKIKKLRTEIDGHVVREEMLLNSEYDKFQRLLNDQKSLVYSQEFFKNAVLPKEVKFDMTLAYRDCFQRFMDNQQEDFDNIETVEGLNDFETLLMKEFENCWQLYLGGERISQIIKERKEILQIAERKEKQIPGSLAEAIRNVSNIRQLPNFIPENEIDLSEAEIDSRRYRAARKASPQLARERRQPPSFYGDIKRYGFGRYRGLEDDYEYPQI